MEKKMIMEEAVKAENLEPAYRVAVTWRNGTLIADEPPSSGGEDTGPDPYTLLLASLASCTLSTLRMYLTRKQWQIEPITVEVNLFQETQPELRTTFVRTLQFPETITPEQKERCLHIANQCPVSKLLKNSIHIETLTYDANTTS